MHSTAFDKMASLIKSHVMPRFRENTSVLEVGSRQTNPDDRSYRELFPKKWRYIGIDMQSGSNVDIICDINCWITSERFDVIVSGQMLEHCAAPWDAVEKMANLLSIGGVVCLTAPWMWRKHNYPNDYWRFSGEGLGELCRRSGLSILESGEERIKPERYDAWCAAIKVESRKKPNNARR